MWEKLKELKKWVVEKVLWAEKEMAGKSGEEKRAVIVAKLDDLIVLPFWLEWADGPVIGWLVDLACEKLNWLTGHDFSEVELDEAQTAEIAECLAAPLPKKKDGGTVEERLEQLCKEYGVEYAPNPEPVKRGDLTEHFNRREFACSCGCGFDDVDPKLAALCETIRRAAGVPVRVNSGCRCEKYNARVKGAAKDSQHVKGRAADLSCSLGPKALYELIQGLYAKGELPGLEYCLRYPTFVHIDVGPVRKQRFAVKR